MNPDSPYKGLVPFEDSELDALLFFGRERESGIISENVLAARLTVLYGPSGVGKSSVLQSGRRSPPAQPGAAERRRARSPGVRGRRLRRMERGSGRQPAGGSARGAGRSVRLGAPRRAGGRAARRHARSLDRGARLRPAARCSTRRRSTSCTTRRRAASPRAARARHAAGAARPRPAVAARRRAGQARPLQGADSESVRELPSTRSPRPALRRATAIIEARRALQRADGRVDRGRARAGRSGARRDRRREGRPRRRRAGACRRGGGRRAGSRRRISSSCSSGSGRRSGPPDRVACAQRRSASLGGAEAIVRAHLQRAVEELTTEQRTSPRTSFASS